MSNLELTNFLTNLLGSERLTSDLRKQALELLLSIEANKIPVSIVGTNIKVALKISEYKEVSRLISAGMLINAIKAFRVSCQDFGTPIGLKEAKDTIDVWNLNI
jgi:hypothetical protein